MLLLLLRPHIPHLLRPRNSWRGILYLVRPENPSFPPPVVRDPPVQCNRQARRHLPQRPDRGEGRSQEPEREAGVVLRQDQRGHQPRAGQGDRDGVRKPARVQPGKEERDEFESGDGGARRGGGGRDGRGAEVRLPEQELGGEGGGPDERGGEHRGVEGGEGWGDSRVWGCDNEGFGGWGHAQMQN